MNPRFSIGDWVRKRWRAAPKSSKIEKQGDTVPEFAQLNTWSVQDWKDGVQIDQCEGREALSVETLNHTYDITVMDPRTAEVMVRGGQYFPEWTAAHLSGASSGGAVLKLHGIYVGLRMEFRVGGKPILTSPVRGISVLEARKSG